MASSIYIERGEALHEQAAKCHALSLYRTAPVSHSLQLLLRKPASFPDWNRMFSATV